MTATAPHLAALDRLDGIRPTPERISRGEVEIVDLRDLDQKGRGRAVRISDGWRPRTLYNRGRITKRQYAAAVLMAELYEQGGFGAVGCKRGYRVGTLAGASSKPMGSLLFFGRNSRKSFFLAQRFLRRMSDT